MKGMITETGAWNGAMPTCAAGVQDDKNSLSCVLLIVLAVLVVLCLVVGAFGIFYCCKTKPAPVAATIVTTTGTPVNDVDIEKAKAQAEAEMLPVIPGFTTPQKDAPQKDRDCGGFACASGPTDAVTTVEVGPVTGLVEAQPVISPPAISKEDQV